MKKIIGGLIGTALLFGVAFADDGISPPPKKKPAPTKKVAIVDINTATQKQLEAIPGIGKEHCHHIIMGRPYETTDELVTREILPKETYDKVKARITVAKKDTPKK